MPWRRDAIDPKEAHFYSGGEALDVRWAQVHTGGQCELESNAASAKFEIKLQEGKDKLFASFYGRGGEVRAPYYIYITKNRETRGDVCV